jgi:hypothetical protein
VWHCWQIDEELLTIRTQMAALKASISQDLHFSRHAHVGVALLAD